LNVPAPSVTSVAQIIGFPQPARSGKQMRAASFQESMRRELSIVSPGLVDTFVHRGARAAVISRGMPSEPARRSASGALLLLACTLLAPSCSRELGPATEAPAPRPEPPRTAAAAPLPAPSTTPVASAPPGADVAPTAPPRPFVVVELAPTQGDLQPLLREHAEKAKARGLKPFVEFYADWCRPCKALASLMNDPFIVEAFTGTYLIKLNFDDWQDKLAEAGFTPREIPMFYALDARGQPTGRKLSGDAWGKATAESMSKALGPFFRR
jgi:thiol-disulfide isomerase/thioredoxin